MRVARRRAWRREGRRIRRWREFLASLDGAKAVELARGIEAYAAAMIERLAADVATPLNERAKLIKIANLFHSDAGDAPIIPASIADLIFMPLPARSSVDRARHLLARLFEICNAVTRSASNEAVIQLAQQSAAILIKALEKLAVEQHE